MNNIIYHIPSNISDIQHHKIFYSFAPPPYRLLVTHMIILIPIHFSFMCLISYCPQADQIMPKVARITEEGEQPVLTAAP